MDAFFKLKRNYIILTNSGKPVFSYKGDMYTLSSIYATLYAMISKLQTYEFQPIGLQKSKLKANPFNFVTVYEGDEFAYNKVIPLANAKKKGNILKKIFSKEKDEEAKGELIGIDVDDDEDDIPRYLVTTEDIPNVEISKKLKVSDLKHFEASRSGKNSFNLLDVNQRSLSDALSSFIAEGGSDEEETKPASVDEDTKPNSAEEDE